MHHAVLKRHLPTAQHLILLGAQVRPLDFPASRTEIRQQLMAWTDDHLARHHTFVYTVLPAIHDDGSHTAENQTNWLTHLAGLHELRVSVAEYLGIRVGAEHRALANAMVGRRSRRLSLVEVGVALDCSRAPIEHARGWAKARVWHAKQGTCSKHSSRGAIKTPGSGVGVNASGSRFESE